MTTLPRFEDDLAAALRAAAPALAAERDRRPAAPRRRRPALLAATAVAATTAVVAAVALAPDRGAPAAASAATLLRQAAIAQVAPPPRTYAYTRWAFTSTVGVAARQSGTQEQWADARGRGERVERGGGRPPSTTRLGGRLPAGSGDVTIADLTRAAADPARLRRLLAAQARAVSGLPSRQARAFVTYELLHGALVGGAPAPARAALLRQMAAVPGLRRAGTAVTLTIGAVRFTLRLRGTTVVGTERRLLRRGAQVPGPPRVLDDWRLVAAGTVGRVGARP